MKKIIIRKHARVCFYFHAVLSINKWSSLSHASLKSYLIMRVKCGWHGRVLEQQLSLCIRFLSQQFTFTWEKPGSSQGRPFLRNFVWIWPLKLNNKLGKITQYDTQAALDVTERSAWNSLWSARVKRPANYTFLWWCNDDPIKQVTVLSTVPRCEWKSWIRDSVQQLVVLQMRYADVKPLWESEREKTWSSRVTRVFSDDWFNLIVCVDLFTHLTYML